MALVTLPELGQRCYQRILGRSLLAATGRNFSRSQQFAERYGLKAVDSWQALVQDVAIDVVVICTVSSLHGEIAEAALLAGKHVVVEYPLSFDLRQAERLIEIAKARGLMLHVEHIELLGGLHLAMRSQLLNIGAPAYVSYRTINPQQPAPKKWTYHRKQFGFPFCGALSRVHRLTNLFGAVSAVSCCTQWVMDKTDDHYFKSVLSSGRLQFANGVVAELTYGKGENLWAYHRDVEVQGSLGAIAFVRNRGTLTTADGETKIEIAPRKGLFLKDTQSFLAYLTEGTPLYVSAAESVYALTVGDALRRASENGQTIYL